MSKQMKVVSQYKALMPAIEQMCTILARHSKGAGHAVFDIDDTLIFDNEHETPNLQIVHLVDVARAYGLQIHLVTARMKSPDVLRWTRAQLKRHGIVYDSLALAPDEMRTSMASVASWKHQQRAIHGRVFLSVGDQWGDLMLLPDDNEIRKLDKFHSVERGPWVIIMPNDGVTQYGLKLMDIRV
jgi:hypothetical protein